MIIFGTQTKGERVRDLAPFEGYCPGCRQSSTFLVKVPVQRFTLYFLPTFKMGGSEAQFQECQSCKAAFVYAPSRPVQRSSAAGSGSVVLLLISAAAHVINADGKVLKEETATAFNLICTLFDMDSEVDSANMLALLMHEIGKPSNLDDIAAEIAEFLQSPEQRSIIVGFLLDIACADNDLDNYEVRVIAKIAKAIGVDRQWLKAAVQSRRSGSASSGTSSPPMDLNWALGIFELSRGFESAELKIRHRTLISQYHPDKVEQLGPELKSLALSKTKEINRAHEILKKSLQKGGNSGPNAPDRP
jgi:uncharacterized tellurite resistance protein B-like protein